MAYRDLYENQVALLIRVMPYVAAENVFALKGGTAVNLFVRDMPRLSVDIDLTYLPVEPREDSLREISAAMSRTGKNIKAGVKSARIHEHILRPENIVSKILVELDGARIKVEVTPVSRGCVYEPVMMSVSESVESRFGFAETQVVSFPDLYAGKIVAALDRQHPRDLFDVRDLLENEGISAELRTAFVVYMLGHNRPMHTASSSLASSAANPTGICLACPKSRTCLPSNGVSSTTTSSNPRCGRQRSPSWSTCSFQKITAVTGHEVKTRV